MALKRLGYEASFPGSLSALCLAHRLSFRGHQAAGNGGADCRIVQTHFGLTVLASEGKWVIVIVEWAGLMLGLIVDKVMDVTQVDQADVELS
jgi:hypothetical protein